MPPIGVIAPSQRSPESASAYRLPEKSTIPASISQPDHFSSADSGRLRCDEPDREQAERVIDVVFDAGVP